MGVQESEPAEGTVGALLGSCLRAAGAGRVFGTAGDGIAGIPGLGHVQVDDPQEAAVLAAAVGRIGNGPGVALLPDRRLLLSSAPGRAATPVVLRDVDDLPALVATWDHGAVTAAVEVRLEVDLDAAAPPGAYPLAVDEQQASAAMTLGADVRDAGLVLLVGPGVVREGRSAQLATLARQAGAPVFTTVGGAGALGTLDPLLAGVVGLQERDAEAAGLHEAPLVVACGVDAADDPVEELVGGQVLDVPPAQLATLGLRWGPDVPPLPPPSPLAAAVERALAPFTNEDEDDAASPATAAQALVAAAGRGALLSADAGPAALWLARAGIPAEPGTLVLPGARSPGFAVAAAAVAALDGRPALAVTTDPPDPLTAALLERVAAWGVDLVVVRWGADAPRLGAEEHTRALRAARRAGGLAQLGVPVDLDRTRALVEALGPVTAWSRANGQQASRG